TAAAPPGEGGAGARRGGQRDEGSACVVRRAARPAVDPGGTRGHGAAAGPGLGDRQGEALSVEGGGDRARRAHGHGAGRAGDRIAAAPAREGGAAGRRGAQGHRRAAVVGGGGGRARGLAVDLGGRLGGNHGAAAGPRLVDGEGDALRVKGGGDRARRVHGHGAARARDRIAAAPAREGGAASRRRGQGHHGAAVVGGGGGPARGLAVDLGGRLGGRHGAAAGPRLHDREGDALWIEGGGDRPRRIHGHGAGRVRDRVADA